MKPAVLGSITFCSGIALVVGGLWFVLDSDHLMQSANTNDTVAASTANTNSANTNTAVVTNGNVNSDSSGVATNTNSGTTTENPHLPVAYSLDVPFTVQAPNGIWDLPYAEACEEASILMAGRYLQGRKISDSADADGAILQLTQYVKDQGLAIDMTAVETAKVLADFYDVDTEVVENFTWDQIKEAIVAGHPVIIPAAGRQLHNPHFQTPGPVYHMLVVKGYNATQVITNDPGTKFGADYAYDYDVLFNAAHDWNGGNVDSGKRVAIIASPKK